MQAALSVALLAFVIALDGPAASGKSSVGLGVGRALGYRYFDTGLLYRALTWLASQRGIAPTDAAELTRLVDHLRVEVDPEGRVWRDGQDLTPQLHQPAVDATISSVSAHSSVRGALVPVQRAMIQPPGLVMAGRDIGTVIAPDAPLKVWLDASTDVRARHRANQTGEPFEDVLAGMRERDRKDGARAVAPMTRSDDAFVVHSDDLPLEAVIKSIVDEALARGAHPSPAGSESDRPP